MQVTTCWMASSSALSTLALAALFLSASALAATTPADSGSTTLAREVKTIENNLTAMSRASAALGVEIAPLVEQRRKLQLKIGELQTQSAEHVRQARDAESRYSRGMEAAQRGQQPAPGRDVLDGVQRAYGSAETTAQALKSALVELERLNQSINKGTLRAEQVIDDGRLASETKRKLDAQFGAVVSQLSSSSRAAHRDADAALRKTGHERSGALAKKLEHAQQRAAALQTYSANAKARLAGVEKSLKDSSHAEK